MKLHPTKTRLVDASQRAGFDFLGYHFERGKIQQDSLLGRYTIRTFWSENGTQLISDVSFQTKDSRDAQLTIVRELADGGKTLVWSSTLKIAGESGSQTLRRVWRKRESA